MTFTVDRSPCNDEVIALLEAYLAYAREGRAGYLALVMCEAPNGVKVSMAGGMPLEPLARVGLQRLDAGLAAAEFNRTPPEPTLLTADFVCWNLARGPFSYDVVTWLVEAEMTRVREGAPAPLKVGFWPGRDGDCAALRNPAYRQMFEQVMRPALALVGGVEDERAVVGRCNEDYTTGPIVRAVRAGEALPRLRSPKPSSFSGEYVTITLRESDQWVYRNSNLDAWRMFAGYLKAHGERVVIVRDTAKGDTPALGAFSECWAASHNLHYRTALYEAAKANLFVANGPAQLAMLGSRPFLVFIEPLPDGHAYHTTTPAFWKAHMGIEIGEQYPWFGDRQRIVWAKDDYETMVAAWEEFQC